MIITVSGKRMREVSSSKYVGLPFHNENQVEVGKITEANDTEDNGRIVFTIELNNSEEAHELYKSFTEPTETSFSIERGVQ